VQQFRSQKSRFGDSITDGAYAAMMNAIHHDEMPGFYFPQSIFNAEAQRCPSSVAELLRRVDRDSQSSFFFAVLGVLRVSALIRFTTADAYAFTREREDLHPDNRHVRDNPVN
jgi:hypothetical protein